MSDLIQRLRDCSDDWPAYLTKLDREAADALEAQAKRIAELERSLDAANSRVELLEHDMKSGDYESLYAHVVAENARLRVGLDAIGMLAEHNIPSYAFGDNEAACDMAGRLSDIQDLSHSANTVGGPTFGAAPACEQLADNEDAVYAVAYKLCLQDGADEDSAHTLIWEGHPPEPWGEVWMRYEFQARELLKALDERRALMANHQATFQSSHECVSRVSNSDSQMNKQDDTRTTGESASKSDDQMNKEKL